MPFRARLVVFLVACTSSEAPITSQRTAAQNRAIVVQNKETQPVYDFAGAIKETVYVEADMDSDGDGKKDLIAADVMRPKETNQDLKVSVVMEASPYYWGSADEQRPTTNIMLPRGFHSWYDEFFVPRGYAVVEVEMQGTSRSLGCPTTGAPEDTKSIVAVIDWLNGRAKAYYKDGSETVASWSTGNVGMLGVSYNGTLPMAVATEGTLGLKTIVPIAGISSWYDYTRDQGIGYSGWDDRYPEMLADYVASASARERCAEQIKKLGDDAGDDSYDFTPFWQARDYRKNTDKVTAAVFMVHGLEDWNVKLHHFSRFWYKIQARDVPRKLWLHRDGHMDPVSIRTEEWKTVMHHWMDHWLYDIDNGVMDEPMTDIQRPSGAWETHDSWPEAGTTVNAYYLGAGQLLSAAQSGVETFTNDATQSEDSLLAGPTEAKSYRLAYLSAPLAQPLRTSGTTRVHAKVSADSTSAPLVALLVDYGAASLPTPVSLSPIELFNMSCRLSDITNRTGCAQAFDHPEVQVSRVVVSRGGIDLKNRSALETAAPLVPGESVEVEWDLQPKDYVFPAGHQIGLVISASDSTYLSVDPLAKSISLSLDSSQLLLPVAP